MQPISSTEQKTIKFDLATEKSKKFRAESSKIGWLHTLSEGPVKFDIEIRDSLGRKRYGQKGVETSGRGGSLINLPTNMGEGLEIVLENTEGKQVEFFVN